jgi:Family of unknown function (DUF5947)
MDAEFNEAPVHQPASCKDGEDSSAPETFAALRRFARSRPEIERCELCGIGLGPEHPHLLEPGSHQITCSCDACAILFCGKEGAKFLRVPRRILQLECFGFDDLAWEAMLLPINLAFFRREPDGRTTAFYPSPAGAMSSLIDLPNWDELFGSESALLSLEPEVEALLVNRIGAQAMHFVVPIDECYRLVGLIRTKWRGLSGGPEVWRAIADFFTSLEDRATRIGKATHA